MSGFTTFGSEAESWSLGSTYDAALGIGGDSSYERPRSSESVPTNAIESMQPVTATTQEWGGFFQQMLKGGVSYAIAKDARQSGVYPTTGTPVATGAVAQAPLPMRGMLMVALLGVAVVIAIKVVK
jgi:hypothetical protein